ncbi:hypothetical protein ACBJ59_12365 [Nonomuraea sp. MTCD27]|uniref:hypothetical protein n=1 Tax=Nonomuraea sp. MTCD27 TaxID=1676747 RepID=UPI0035C0AD52
MARHTLIRIAIAGTALLCAVTVATAVTGHGSDRLHMTLLTGSLAAVLATVGYAGIYARTRIISAKLNNIEARLRDVSTNLDNAVCQVADELHTAVEVQSKTLQRDRIAAVRILATHLRKPPPADRGDGQVA